MVDTILRWLVQWKGRRKAAQIIVFDGGAEIDKARSFFRGTITGIVISSGIFLLTAPNAPDSALLAQARHREQLLRESDQRVKQAMAVTDVCLNTAEKVQRTLESYQQLLRER